MGCSSLVILVLSNNKLQGQLFSRNFNLTRLGQLELDGNEFSGSIPDSLSNSLNLTTLEVSNNQLSGRIPRWMGNMQYLEEILMADNQIQGPIPEEFCKLNLQLKFLDLSMNNISGTLPPCLNLSGISQVLLTGNNLQGSFSVAFHDSSLLVTLDLSYNRFSGNIPNWISRLSNLSYLLLTGNHFEGEIPIQLCKLTHLSLIDLSHNNLSGHIPNCLNVSASNHISTQYVHPIYISDIGFQKPIIIEKPVNYTIKGRSYSYKGKVLGYLSGIDLSCNKLTGEIPHETKNFRMVNALNFSHNSLIGPIPQALSKLGQIECLDLSFNNLSGNIPPELVELNFLVSFNVSYNNLSGRTPNMFQQFALFDESSYLANPFLCGAPLQKNCSRTEPSSPSMPEVNNDGLIDWSIFYVTFVVAYIVMLLAIILVLYINPYWRRAWFYRVEMVTTFCYYFVVDHLLR